MKALCISAMETSSIPETKMLTLRIGPCQMLKMTFIIGLLVGLYCSDLTTGSWETAKKLSLWCCHYKLFPAGDIPLSDVPAQLDQVPGCQGDGDGEHSVSDRGSSASCSHLLPLQPEQVNINIFLCLKKWLIQRWLANLWHTECEG